MSANAEEAARLKAEGNELFEKKKFSQAYDKYTKALKEGGDNAIIYANRAACLIGLRKFLDAVNDAQKATEIDPKYAKGWGRLASAHMGLCKGLSAKDAYQKAIECFQGSDLTPAQLKQMKIYQDGLREAEELARPKKADLPTVSKENVQYMPWHRGVEVLKGINNLPKPPRTSAWLIGKAYEEWEEGMVKMRSVEQTIRSMAGKGPAPMYFPLDVVTCLTNAVLRDHRVFHISEKNWKEMFERQANYEIKFSNGWIKEGPKVILKEAQARVKRDGWDQTLDALGNSRGGVRQAMGTSVRIWIMKAFLLNGMNSDSLAAEAIYSDTLDFLESGRKIWADVPSENRGTIFSDTFVQGIRVLHLESYMTSTVKTMKGKYTLKKLLEAAIKLFEDAVKLNENKPPLSSDGLDIGFFAAFYEYPVGEALRTMACCYSKLGHAEGDEEKKRDHYKQAGQFYHQSIKYFFEDDEYYCHSLFFSLGCYWKSGAGLDVTLSIMKALKVATPKMMRIWGRSTLVAAMSRPIEICLAFYEEVLLKISQGELAKDAQYLPDADTLNSLPV